MLRIEKIQHPDYTSGLKDWRKWRFCYEGGDAFKDAYLKQLSTREEEEDFERRKEISPIPRHAGAAIDEIKNSICVRLPDVKRTDGPKSYLDAALGLNGGVDRRGMSMNGFFSEYVLPEMLNMRQVMVFVDKEPIEEGATKLQTDSKQPYLYYYPVEDIMSWEMYYANGHLSYKTILIKQYISTYADDTGLPTGTGCRYLRMWIDKRNKVSAQYYNETKVPDDLKHEISDEYYFAPGPIVELGISTIPVVQFCIKKSLMEDVANHQIALLNMESTDIAYAFGSNFPIYTEQYSPQQAINHIQQKDPQTGEVKSVPERVVGVSHGRRYPDKMERPGFINPSSEPLEISMKKESQLKDDIRMLVGLSVASLNPTHASAESKGMDNQTIEAGLAAIGMELQLGEQRIAQIWAEYQGDAKPTSIIYPTNYSLVTEDQRLNRAKTYKELQGAVPSLIFQKELAKQLSRVLLEGKIPQDKMTSVLKEVDAAQYITSDPEAIKSDLEMGLVSEVTASNARGYDGEKEVPKARIEHAERAARILLAQTKAAGKADDSGSDGTDPQARGVDTLSSDPAAGEKEKKASQSAELNPERTKKVRS